MAPVFPYADQYLAGVLTSKGQLTGVHVLNWRDQLCAPDTLGMAVAMLFSKETLRSAGPLGAVFADLQDALSQQDRSGIDAAQGAAEELLVQLLPGHVSGRHIGVADLWEAMASMHGSRLGLGGVAVGRCGCGKTCPQIAPNRVIGWQYNNAVSISIGQVHDGTGIADAVDVAMHNLRAARNRSSQCCGSMMVYDVQVNPAEAVCVICSQDTEGAAAPELNHLLVSGQLFTLRAVVVRDAAHYTAYVSAERLPWLAGDGWYYYDGIRSGGQLVFLGSSLRIDQRHMHKIEMLLFKRDARV